MFKMKLHFREMEKEDEEEEEEETRRTRNTSGYIITQLMNDDIYERRYHRSTDER